MAYRDYCVVAGQGSWPTSYVSQWPRWSLYLDDVFVEQSPDIGFRCLRRGSHNEIVRGLEISSYGEGQGAGDGSLPSPGREGVV